MISSAHKQTVRYSRSAVDSFAVASRDFSPLHVSDAYARTSPYGQRVVHGVCGILGACGCFRPPVGFYPSALSAVFYQPILMDLDYEIRILSAGENRTSVSVFDGSTEVTKIIFDFLPGTPPIATLPVESSAPLVEARELSESDLTSGWECSGEYSPSADNYAEMLLALGLNRSAWGDALPIALMATSYLTGMEMPGERALYFRLIAEFPSVDFSLPCLFKQTLTNFDPRYGMVRSNFGLSSGDALWSRGDIHAFVRPPRAALNPVFSAIPSEIASSLSNKVALVVGASRGLGFSLALTLAAAGATVVATYLRSVEDAERLLKAARGLPGTVLLRQCDMSDPAACAELRAEILDAHGRLDWLVCSAIPSLQVLRIEPAAFHRIDSFLRSGFALTLAPLSNFLDLLAARSGSVLLISSVFVEDPPALWPHYVALKCAVEGLARVAVQQFPEVSFCLARPTKLLTDLVNTPFGRMNAEDPATAALRILSEAVSTGRPGEVCLLK